MAEESLHVHSERVRVFEVVRQHHRPCHDHHLEIEHAADERRGQQGHARLPAKSSRAGGRRATGPLRAPPRHSHRGRGGGGDGRPRWREAEVGSSQRQRWRMRLGSGMRGQDVEEAATPGRVQAALPAPCPPQAPPARARGRAQGRGVPGPGTGASATPQRPGQALRPVRGKRRRRHLVPLESGWMLWSCSCLLPGGGKIQNPKGRGGSRDGASRNSLSRHQLGCFRPPAQRLGRWCGDTSSGRKAHRSAKCPGGACDLQPLFTALPGLCDPCAGQPLGGVASRMRTEIISKDFIF